MGFEFIKDVEIRYTREGVIVGTLTKTPEWVKLSNGRESFTNKGGIAVRAENVAYLMDWLEETAHNITQGQQSRGEGTWGAFYAFPTWDECWDTMRNHPYKINKFDPNTSTLQTIATAGNEISYDVTGAYFDIGRVLEGEPECWGTPVMGNPKGLFATIILSTGAPASVYEETMRRRSERILRMVNWLESQGVRTEIIALSCNECGYLECVVKRHEDSINLDTLAVVSSPDFHRRVVFRMRELSATWSAGYGHTFFFREGKMQLPPIHGRGILLISENYTSTWAVDTAYEIAEKEITEMIEEGQTTFTKIV